MPSRRRDSNYTSSSEGDYPKQHRGRRYSDCNDEPRLRHVQIVYVNYSLRQSSERSREQRRRSPPRSISIPPPSGVWREHKHRSPARMGKSRFSPSRPLSISPPPRDLREQKHQTPSRRGQSSHGRRRRSPSRSPSPCPPPRRLRSTRTRHQRILPPPPKRFTEARREEGNLSGFEDEFDRVKTKQRGYKGASRHGPSDGPPPEELQSASSRYGPSYRPPLPEEPPTGGYRYGSSYAPPPRTYRPGTSSSRAPPNNSGRYGGDYRDYGKAPPQEEPLSGYRPGPSSSSPPLNDYDGYDGARTNRGRPPPQQEPSSGYRPGTSSGRPRRSDSEAHGRYSSKVLRDESSSGYRLGSFSFRPPPNGYEGSNRGYNRGYDDYGGRPPPQRGPSPARDPPLPKQSPNPDPYLAIGVPNTASVAEIKRVYRKLAVKEHPDKHPKLNTTARADQNDKFSAISAAHELLTDAKKRADYDNRVRRERFGL